RMLFAEGPKSPGGAVRASVDVRPEPQCRQPGTAHSFQRLLDVPAGKLVLGGDGVLHDDQVAVLDINPLSNAAVPGEGIEAQFRRLGDRCRWIDGRAAGHEDPIVGFAHATYSLA